MIPPDFKPPLFLRGTLTQTFLASMKWRKRGPNAMRDAAVEHIIECRDGIRLLGSYSKHPKSKGVMIFLHGWEGSQDSTYVLCCARYLYDHGYSVFRLNFRDHGDSHHLNEGLFHGPLLNEVVDGVRYACGLQDEPAYITGFSLGGNFALRVVREAKAAPIPKLAHVFSICPVINPFNASPIGDQNIFIRRYFVRKWSKSLTKKQALFPELYDFSDALKQKSIMGISDSILSNYMTDFANPQAFFDAYRIWPDDLADAQTPFTIITSNDDPIVPVSHLDDLKLSEKGNVIRLNYGGHNGFFDSLMGPTWYDRYILSVLETS